ncbi:uncharacterized [Tachysurus ichikawai]
MVCSVETAQLLQQLSGGAADVSLEATEDQCELKDSSEAAFWYISLRFSEERRLVELTVCLNLCQHTGGFSQQQDRGGCYLSTGGQWRC